MPVPGRTGLSDDRDATRAIVLRLGCSDIGTVWLWSAKTEMPASDSDSKPACDAEIVYVSGPSEMKMKRPEASVFTCAICDGLVAVTSAPAIGAFVDASTTLPTIVPVVAAPATLQHCRKSSAVAIAAAIR